MKRTIDAVGYDLDGVVPDPLWIQQTWELFVAGKTHRPGGLYSFSTVVKGAYRIATQGVGSGRSAGDVLRLIPKSVGLACTDESIDGVPVVTCYVDWLNSSMRIVRFRDRLVRCACVEPWANTFNWYFFWLARGNTARVVFDHEGEEWLG